MSILDKFLSGNFDDLFQKLKIGRTFSTTSSKYTPYDRTLLPWGAYDSIGTSNPLVLRSTAIWQKNIKKYPLVARSNVSNSERKNKSLESKIETIIKNDVSSLLDNIVQILARKGNVIMTKNADDNLIAQHPDYYKLYYDRINQTAYGYSLVVDGSEKIKDLQHKEDLFHIRNPFESVLPLGTPPIDFIIEQVYTFLHTWQYYNEEWSGGLSGNSFAKVKEAGNWAKELDQIVDNQTKKRRWMDLAETISNWFKRAPENRKTKLIPLPWLEDIIMFGKSPAEMKSDQMFDKIVEFVAMGYNLAGQDLGFGKTTYNNTEVFTDQQFENIGTPLCSEVEKMINSWYLPVIVGVETKYTNSDFDFEVRFEKPTQEDTINKQKNFVSMISVSGQYLSQLEIRAAIKEVFDLNINPENIPEEIKKKDDVKIEKDNNEKKFQFAKKKAKITPINWVQKALDSSLYSITTRTPNGSKTKKGFLPKLEKAFEAQLKQTLENIKKRKEVKDIDLAKDFVKLESVLPFNVLKSELLNFADFGRNSVLSEVKKIKESIQDLSDTILNYFDIRTQLLLQGWDSLSKKQQRVLEGEWEDTEYEGVDAKTLAQIMRVLENNLDKPIDELIDIINDKFKSIAGNRAVEIVETEIANAVEYTRYQTYVDEFDSKWKRHVGVNDDREVAISRQASNAGIVAIDYVYRHDIGDGLKVPLHFRDRSSMVYSVFDKSDLEF